jgi:hypothetical protein
MFPVKRPSPGSEGLEVKALEMTDGSRTNGPERVSITLSEQTVTRVTRLPTESPTSRSLVTNLRLHPLTPLHAATMPSSTSVLALVALFVVVANAQSNLQTYDWVG